VTRTCVLVAGVPRSGTSAAAGVVHRLGFPTHADYLPAWEMNPRGFYQDGEFDALFDALPEWVPDYPGRMPESVRAGVRDLTAGRCQSGRPWSAKFRLAAWVVSDVAAACEDSGYALRVVTTCRPPAESVASLTRWAEAHDQPPAEVVSRCRRACGALPDFAHRVGFADLLTSPAAEVARLAAYLGVPAAAGAVAFVDPTLRRFGRGG